MGASRPRVLLSWREPAELAGLPVKNPGWLNPLVVVGLAGVMSVGVWLGAAKDGHHPTRFSWPETPVVSLVLAATLVYGGQAWQRRRANRGWITREAVGRNREGISHSAWIRDVACVSIRQEAPGKPGVLDIRRKDGTSFSIGLGAGLSWARVRKTLRDLGVPEA